MKKMSENVFRCSVKPRGRFESENAEKYLDLAREVRKLWNMNVTDLSSVIGTLGTATGKKR